MTSTNVPLPVLRNRRFWPTHGDEEVRKPVVVEVADRDAHAVQLDVEARRARDIGERAVAVVAIQPQRRPLPLVTRPVHAVDEQDVLPAVARRSRGTRSRSRASRAGACRRRRRCCAGTARPAAAVTSTRRKPGGVCACAAEIAAPDPRRSAAKSPQRRQRRLERIVAAVHSAGSFGLTRPCWMRVDDELGRLVDAERVHDVGAVHGDGVHAQVELRGDRRGSRARRRSAAALRARAA